MIYHKTKQILISFSSRKILKFSFLNFCTPPLNFHTVMLYLYNLLYIISLYITQLCYIFTMFLLVLPHNFKSTHSIPLELIQWLSFIYSNTHTFFDLPTFKFKFIFHHYLLLFFLSSVNIVPMDQSIITLRFWLILMACQPM